AGVEYAKAQGFSTPTTKTIDDISAKNLEHEIELSLLHIAAEAATLARGLEFYWEQVDVEDADALMGIIDRANNKANYFFIEIERSPLGKYRPSTFVLENGKRIIRN